jgi:hypothetical protein
VHNFDIVSLSTVFVANCTLSQCAYGVFLAIAHVQTRATPHLNCEYSNVYHCWLLLHTCTISISCRSLLFVANCTLSQCAYGVFLAIAHVQTRATPHLNCKYSNVYHCWLLLHTCTISIWCRSLLFMADCTLSQCAYGVFLAIAHVQTRATPHLNCKYSNVYHCWLLLHTCTISIWCRSVLFVANCTLVGSRIYFSNFVFVGSIIYSLMVFFLSFRRSPLLRFQKDEGCRAAGEET